MNERVVSISLPPLMYIAQVIFYEGVVGHKTYNLVQATAQFPSS